MSPGNAHPLRVCLEVSSLGSRARVCVRARVRVYMCVGLVFSFPGGCMSGPVW